MSEANKVQVGGKHYKGITYHGIPIEHWDIVAVFELDYFQGQITKYVMRHKGKNGLEDLKKARHFLDKYIEVLETKPDDKPIDDRISPSEKLVVDNHGFGHVED